MCQCLRYFGTFVAKTVSGIGHIGKPLGASTTIGALQSVVDKNITQIAYDCGFNDISNLSRRFKAEFMVTPSEYRKMHAVRPPHRTTAMA
ncbi:MULTISPECIES: helix-turn-helix domain-containing protein [Symbiopectobacterium]|uniref:helix-turn-helix domain-containing protein n=1 Tax=Symbiopectobacterium TaxID=801 RepID=UPI00207AC928|nr:MULTISPECIES: helix-turn-helix domain-containing protein [Symbiopectobacterium]